MSIINKENIPTGSINTTKLTISNITSDSVKIVKYNNSLKKPLDGAN